MKTISKFQINVTPDSSFIVANFANEWHLLNTLKLDSLCVPYSDMVRVRRIVIHDCEVANLLYKGAGEYVFKMTIVNRGGSIIVVGDNCACEDVLFKCEIGYRDA